MPVAHWIYPTNPSSDYHLDNPDGPTEVSPQQLLKGIEQAPDKVDAWNLSTGYRTMRPGDAVWIYAADQYQSICALARAVDVYHDIDGWHVALIWNLDATRKLMRNPIPRSEFAQIAQQSAVRANPTTATVLAKWLRSTQIRLGDLESEQDPSSVEDARFRVMRSIVQRQGHAGFRQQLLDAYGRRCAVTGESAEAVLEAAHIQPYLGPRTNDVTNGLLLRADLHTLFDVHLIGVDPNGNLVVSPRLDGTSYANRHGTPVNRPLRAAQQPSKRRLAAHLKQLA